MRWTRCVASCAQPRKRSSQPRAEEPMRTRELTVEELMTTALVTARVDDVIANVDFEMKMADIRHIPVVDDRGRLVGIVSQRDILRARVRADSKAIPIRSLMTKS